MNNYTQLASIRPMVLSSSVYRHAGTTVFPPGRRASITLVNTPDGYRFKLGNKQPLFTAENLPDGTVKLTSTHTDFPCWLTVAGADFIRLAKKAKLTPEELFLTPEEAVIDHFKAPTLDDCDDLADFANQHLAPPTPHQVPSIVPNPQQRAPRISNKYKQRITLIPPQRGTIYAPAPPTTTATPAIPRKLRRTPAAASYTSEQFDQDVALLWG